MLYNVGPWASFKLIEQQTMKMKVIVGIATLPFTLETSAE